MRAGSLRHKITIEQVTEARTGSGAVTETWETVVTLRAEKNPLSGREYFDSLQVQEANQVRFKTRYYPGLNTKMRLVHNGVNYDIHSIINPQERNKELLFLGVEYGD